MAAILMSHERRIHVNLRKFLQLSYNRVRYRGWSNPARAFDKSRFLVPFRQFLHPPDPMALKFEGQGSLPLANCLALLYLACQVARYFGTGYLFSSGSRRISTC